MSACIQNERVAAHRTGIDNLAAHEKRKATLESSILHAFGEVRALLVEYQKVRL
jgi:hypothetical protein